MAVVTANGSQSTMTPYGKARVFDEVCRVCGDRATDMHYSVTSCNGCKTFFRRSVVCGRRYVCQKEGQCSFNKEGRCYCRACRFQKCVESGMNHQGIQNLQQGHPYHFASITKTDQKVIMQSRFVSNDMMYSEVVTRPVSPHYPSSISSIGVSPVPPQLNTIHIQSMFENNEVWQSGSLDSYRVHPPVRDYSIPEKTRRD